MITKIGFSVKRIFSPRLIYHKLKCLRNKDGVSTQDGTFIIYEIQETIFHYSYFFMEDEKKTNFDPNLNNKTGEAATGPPLSDTEIDTRAVTKEGQARLV